MSESSKPEGVDVDRDVGRWLCVPNGPSAVNLVPVGNDAAGPDVFVKAAELDRLRAENERRLALLRDIEANARRAWADRSLSAAAWPAEMAQRLTAALCGPSQE